MARSAHAGQATQLDIDQDEFGDPAPSTTYTVPREDVTDTYGDEGSHQWVAVDLELEEDAGSDDEPKYLAPGMGNVIGASLTKLMTYVAGWFGKYSVTGAKASSYPHAALIGEIGDGTTGADAAVMAVLGGDSEVTTVRALFGVDNQNSVPNSKADFGLDLQGVAHDGYGLLEVTVAARLGSNVCVLLGDGAPTSGATGTGDNVAGPGSIYVDFTNSNAYIQAGLITAPDWKLVTRAA